MTGVGGGVLRCLLALAAGARCLWGGGGAR